MEKIHALHNENSLWNYALLAVRRFAPEDLDTSIEWKITRDHKDVLLSPVLVEKTFGETMNNGGGGATVFSLRAMCTLPDILVQDSHIIHTITYDGVPRFFHVCPSYPDCGEPFPTYASIAKHLPEDMHYFRKFRNADYYLVTETFKQRWKAAKLKGPTFLLRYDGTCSYPKVPGA